MGELGKEIDPADIQRDIVNDLVKGIVRRLHEAFGDSYTFYAEDVPQGFKTPSFAVISMDVVREQGLKTRKYWRFPFDILYFCDGKKPRQEWNRVEQKLALELEWLDACNAKLKAEIQPSHYDSDEEVGHFYVVYGMHLADIWEEPDKMEQIQIPGVEGDDSQHVGGKCDNESCPIDWR